jgi:predicted molibdopterin-dependent oxidoreductase YjgC
MTENRLAGVDVVLPATAWPEKPVPSATPDVMVQMGRRIDPPGDACAGFRIIHQLNKRMGCGWDYKQSMQESLRFSEK